MTLRECYAAMGGDYEDALGRLRSEKLVNRFVLRFLDDKSYDLLCASMDAKDYGEAFRAAHTIKGVCSNLAFTVLGRSSSELSEALRYGYTPGADALVEQVKEDYRQTMEAIRAYQEAAGE